ncbi:AraC family transcriptional regulator [Shinella sp. PSBB067]|uniref:AraC family transcriptional regulator n=1 Tax=Shinella sp. PSBB067 TaxID=2715959 RepID=UPI00193C5CF1|nr:AraC family transcriptional regulator [Shinella sp. PSBB067]QRI64304.1 AraC family transcriptional regulator [Shinella sp. PSBB067]
MQVYSREKAADHSAANAVAGAVEAPLERSCAERDRIVVAPELAGIERIEARFRGKGFEPHRHDTYALGVTMAGIQTFRYRGEEQFSPPGNVIVLHPDEVHDGGAGTDDGLTYRMMYIPPERFLPATAHRGRALPFVAAPVVDDPGLARLLLDAFGGMRATAEPLAIEELVEEIAAALLDHAGAPQARTGRPAGPQVQKACDFLRENLSRRISSADLEDVTGLDRFALARQFRLLLGTSPHRYLVMRRLERAKGLIAAGESIAEAAFASGFADQAHLNRHFKKALGMTPGRFAALAA